jgi:hypothetical protein
MKKFVQIINTLIINSINHFKININKMETQRTKNENNQPNKILSADEKKRLKYNLGVKENYCQFDSSLGEHDEDPKAPEGKISNTMI